MPLANAALVRRSWLASLACHTLLPLGPIRVPEIGPAPALAAILAGMSAGLVLVKKSYSSYFLIIPVRVWRVFAPIEVSTGARSN